MMYVYAYLHYTMTHSSRIEQQVASILTSARPKIQGWISNAESDDPESLGTPDLITRSIYD